jgi:hypothetical protein
LHASEAKTVLDELKGYIAKSTNPERRSSKQTVVTANRFTVTDPDGQRRISLFVEADKAMLCFYDKEDMPRFLIAVNPDGSSVMTAMEPNAERTSYEDSFRLIVSSGEAELVVRDTMFKNASVMTPKGFFAVED